MRATIYGLFWYDGFDEKCFWIGRTTQNPPQRRWANGGPSLLVRPSDAGKFLFRLLAQGIQPEFQILQRCTVEESADAERYWIRRMADRGMPLLNSFSGGKKGAHLADFLPHAAVTRARRANPEVYAKIGAILRGRKFSPERRAQISATVRRRYENPEERAKTSRSLLGHTVSAETREKIAAANRRTWASPEMREKQGAQHRGKTLPAEHRAKISAGVRRWAREREARASSAEGD